LPTDIKQFL